MKNKLKNLALTIASIIITFLFIEVVAQIYVYKFAKKGKLFTTDQELGWKVLPNLDFFRKNADGELWKIKTNKDGFRKKSSWAEKGKKILILGDSFAFGEGVNIEDRFDHVFEKMEFEVLNTGVMGYGTDQSYLKAKPFLTDIKKGDVIIVLTYFNDFYDMLNLKNLGRSKPRLEIKADSFFIHPPSINFKDKLRNRSYIFSKISSRLAERKDFSDVDISTACNLYKKIIQELKEKESQIIIAFHGFNFIENKNSKNKIEATINNICQSSQVQCLDLDQHFNFVDHSNYFLKDGHWNNAGNKIVSKLLEKEILKISNDTNHLN